MKIHKYFSLSGSLFLTGILLAALSVLTLATSSILVSVPMAGRLAQVAAASDQGTEGGDAAASSWYVSVNGSPNGDGSISNPWDLETALQDNTISTNKNYVVKPGDTIWLRAGNYSGKFFSSLKGAPGQQIIVRAYQNERATIDGAIIHNKIGSGWTTYWGLEFTKLGNPRRVSTQTLSFPTDIAKLDSFQPFVPGIKIINSIIHDNVGSGGVFGMDSIDAEVYGNISYNNGWDAPDRGHGHGIYLQNDIGTKVIEDNIAFGNLGGYGLHAYGENAKVYNMDFKGNAVFNNSFIVWAHVPANNISVSNNYFFGANSNFSFGMSTGVTNQSGTVTGNYFAIQALNLLPWQQLTFTTNKVKTNGIGVYLAANRDTSGYLIDQNQYINHVTFSVNDSNYQLIGTSASFATWQSWNFDLGGSYTLNTPTQADVFVRKNKYDDKRAHIIIYNWANQSSVAADVSGVLQIGDTYEIRDAQNYFGAPLLSGTYSGSPIQLPMNVNTISGYQGDFSGAYHSPVAVHTPTEFGALVLIKTETYVPPPLPISGACGTTINSCISGTFSEVDDTATTYLWQCLGSNGGTTASCSLPKPVVSYTLSVARGGTGSGNVSGGSINCGSFCSQTAPSGTVITLTATPDYTSSFAGWGEACPGTSLTCVITLNSDLTLSAMFEILPAPADSTPPSKPTNLSYSNISQSSVTLSWSASADDIGVVGYEVFRDGVLIGGPTIPSFIDNSVTAGVTYTYTVLAYDAAGNVSAQSTPLSVAVPLPSTPSVSILSYRVSKKTASTATIIWTTNIPTTGTVYYGTSVNNLNRSAIDPTLSTSHTLTLSNLTRAAKYYYDISVTDSRTTAVTPISSFRTGSK